ncbi:MAG: cobalamin-dependent protein, partial [Spirochaetales bacterium]|nr:cobalamin-dependent protein [Spirochaetales bacterium]MCF7939034.1 cobalamin-dependent protein [Spirochaetales bacterium]
MKITLIAPGWKKEYKSRRKRSRVFSVPPLGLQNIAAVTPSDIEIDFIDEGIEEVTFDTDTDLVGITATSAGAPRAYEIGDGFQELGVPVVMGGPHVSYMVDEALEHCDSVVVGEGEGSWETLIDDFRRGGKDALSKTYQ